MRRFILFAALAACAPLAIAQPQEFRPDETIASVTTRSMRISERTGYPLVVFGTDYTASGADAEMRAREYLRAQGTDLGIDESNLVLVASRETPGGSRVRFEQREFGYPVFQSDVVVSLSRSGRVAFLVNGFKQGVDLRTVASKSSSSQAAQTALDYLGVTTQPQIHETETVIYHNRGRSRLAHRVEVIARGSVQGDWQLLVDDESGAVFRAENRAQVHGKSAGGNREPRAPRVAAPAVSTAPAMAPRRRVDGSGWVFDPDPLSRARAVYGGSFGDNNDTDSQDLTDQLVEVTLRDIAFDGTTYTLDGPYARIRDSDPPMDGVFSQDSLVFHYTRGHDAFEAVNAYYHIDKSLRYINETLGFTVMPHQYTGGVFVDPHGSSGDDNSFYSPTDGLLSFGEGGVDDAEDPDVLLHELGHGLHDWLTNGGLSIVEGLSEGSGDYWANSYSRSTGSWGAAEDQRAWVFHWDGHNEFFDGRVADYDAHYPDGLIQQIHTDGQIWSSSLMEIWEILGRRTTDLLFLEGLSMTGSATSQADAAFAVLQADTLLNAGANAAVIKDVFLRRGYLAVRTNFASSVTAGIAPLTVTFIDGSSGPGAGISSWQWDFNGDGVIDSNSQLANYTYENPGLYTVSLTVSDGTSETSTTRVDFISVNEGVYLWQGGAGLQDRSGDFLRDYFDARQVSHAYAGSERVHTPLTGYDAVFVSFGSFDGGATELDAAMAGTLKDYLLAGGKVYLEGSEALGFDQADNTSVLAAFGITSSDDGTDAETPPQNMTGSAAAITNGLSFGGTTQAGTSWIDRFTPQPPALAAFNEPGYGTVAVQSELAGGGRSFVLSYAVGHLVDGVAPNTRAELLDRVLDYFGIAAAAVSVEDADLPQAFALLPAYPNPFSSEATLRYELPSAARVTLSVYNTLGQRVGVLENGVQRQAGAHSITLDAASLASGTYFARLEAGGQVSRQTLLLVR